MASDNKAYCDYDGIGNAAISGKFWKLAVFDKTGEELMAVTGQRGLTINRSRDSTDASSKDTQGWKSQTGGLREWSIDTDGLYVTSSESLRALNAYYEGDDPVCIKVYDDRDTRGLFGGLATITDFSLEAPYDDNVTYSVTLTGVGALVDLIAATPEPPVIGEITPTADGATVELT